MKFFVQATVALLAVAAASSSALRIVDLAARAIVGPTKGYNCDGTPFTKEYITQAITQAAKIKYDVDTLKELPRCDLSSSHARDLDFCQPKDFKNHEGVLHFPNCPKGPWHEFPLMSDGKTIYEPPKAPGTANPARVIFQYTDATTAHFCGAVTHSSTVPKGQFISCTAI